MRNLKVGDKIYRISVNYENGLKVDEEVRTIGAIDFHLEEADELDTVIRCKDTNGKTYDVCKFLLKDWYPSKQSAYYGKIAAKKERARELLWEARELEDYAGKIF